MKQVEPARPDAKIVTVVIGMHRSGTSVCAHILSVLGLDMATEIAADLGNELGHYERLDLVALQDRVLLLFDRVYSSPMHDFPMPPGWWMDFRLRPIKEEIKTLLSTVLQTSRFVGFKDPRTTRLLPLWNQIFAELGLRARFIICLRHPSSIAASLHKRDGLDPESGELRSLSYMIDALRYTEGKDRLFLHYDDWFPNPIANAEKLADFVGSVELDRFDFELAVRSAVRPEMNRSRHVDSKARSPLPRTFFDLVCRLAADEHNREIAGQIQKFCQHYLAFQQTLHPIEMSLAHARQRNAELEGSHDAAAQLPVARRASLDHQMPAAALEHLDDEARAEAAALEARAGQATTAQMAEVAGLRSEVARLQAANQSLAARDRDARSETKALTARMQDLQATNQMLAAREADWQQAIASQNSGAEDYAAQTEALQEANGNLVRREADAQRAAAAHLAKVHSLTAQTEELQAAHRDLAAREADAKRIADAHAAEIVDLRARAEELQTANQDLATKVTRSKAGHKSNRGGWFASFRSRGS